MPDACIQARVAALTAVLRVPDGAPAPARPWIPDLVEMKRWLDDTRLNLWGKLRAAHEPELEFESRFRLRRAVELCRGLIEDLRADRLNLQLEEVPVLAAAAQELNQVIQSALQDHPPAAV